MTAVGRRTKCVESLSCGDSTAGSPYPSAFSRLDPLQLEAKFSCKEELQDLLEPQGRRGREEVNRREGKRGVRG